MLSTFSDPILPVFAILALGVLAGWRGWFDVDFARNLNRFTYYVAQPALVYFVVARAPFAAFDYRALGLYLVSEIAVYALGYWVVRRYFGRTRPEALLLGMTCALVNHLFYILPIAERIYGEEAAANIAGIIIVDIALLFCGTILILDIMKAGNAAPGKVARMTIGNPALLAIVAGLGTYALEPLTPQGVFTFAEFVGRAAPPSALFALGIIVAGTDFRRPGGATWSVVAIKTLAHPILLIGMFAMTEVDVDKAEIALLVAAGPCGAMPFVIALQYGIKTDTIARAILISTGITLFTLAWLTA
ncbi:AEC family transporter [Pontivivens nitratireducens]|uniref:AEC family transporter n=1 Tax=Pontivivens nitratireducens TaxID=2758038 RepID=UPI001639EE9B|nr:AEC family transporter [Pontibrevibacter nitratireducens]